MLGLLFTNWGWIVLAAVVTCVVVLYRAVKDQKAIFERTLAVKQRRGGSQILVLIDGKRSARVANIAFRRAFDPLRLTVVISDTPEEYRGVQRTCVDYGGRVLSFSSDTKKRTARLLQMKRAFVRPHHRHILVLSGSISGIRQNWDMFLSGLSRKEPSGTAVTCFPKRAGMLFSTQL